jgi:hypothetical protein
MSAAHRDASSLEVKSCTEIQDTSAPRAKNNAESCHQVSGQRVPPNAKPCGFGVGNQLQKLSRSIERKYSQFVFRGSHLLAENDFRWSQIRRVIAKVHSMRGNPGVRKLQSKLNRISIIA